MRVVSESSSEEDEEERRQMEQHMQNSPIMQGQQVNLQMGTNGQLMGLEPRVEPIAEDGSVIQMEHQSPQEVVVINQDNQEINSAEYVMRTSQPAPNQVVFRNGKKVPSLHAARPLHLPPERFGTSVQLRKDFVTQPLPFADRSHTLQVIC